MISEASQKKELLTAIDECVSRLKQLASSVDDKAFNTVPYKNSWTPGQLLQHVSKSTAAIAGAMQRPGAIAERDPAERIAQLRDIFLDFSTKLNAPDFIVPEEGPYEKQSSLSVLQNAFEALAGAVTGAHLNELVKGLPMGEVTKLELLHFVWYHTQRHLHQMEKIVAGLKNRD